VPPPTAPSSSTLMTRRSTRVTIVVACVVVDTAVVVGAGRVGAPALAPSPAVVSSQAAGGCDASTDTMPNMAVALNPVASTRPAGAAFLRVRRAIVSRLCSASADAHDPTRARRNPPEALAGSSSAPESSPSRSW
jgi:hypothetical protein